MIHNLTKNMTPRQKELIFILFITVVLFCITITWYLGYNEVLKTSEAVHHVHEIYKERYVCRPRSYPKPSILPLNLT